MRFRADRVVAGAISSLLADPMCNFETHLTVAIPFPRFRASRSSFPASVHVAFGNSVLSTNSLRNKIRFIIRLDFAGRFGIAVNG